MTAGTLHAPSLDERYLAFQLFTASHDSPTLQQNFPPAAVAIDQQVDGIVHAIGTVGNHNRKLGFVVGPLSFDQTDEQIRNLIRVSFAVALQKEVAVGFHVDDSMFWGRLTDLDNPQNIEWIDWNKTPNTGRRLDWSSTPTKIRPQLCLNSPAVEEVVKRRAALIGEEVARGIKTLHALRRDDLFIGVIAGWETQIGRDFDTGKPSGYHALANKGYSAKSSPEDLDQARAGIVSGFIDLWSKSLAQAGVPEDKIYSHTAFMPHPAFELRRFSQPEQPTGTYLETINFTPLSASFVAHHRAGFSTYPQLGLLEEIQAERAKNGDPPWASSEGTAADPAAVEKGDPGVSMERYLGNLFNRGAALVNVFGWGVGPASNPFRRIAESQSAISAYQKFLHGDDLTNDPPAQLPSAQFFDRLRQLQKELPPYLAAHGPEKVGRLYDELGGFLQAQRYGDAGKVVDEILQAIRGSRTGSDPGK